MRGALAIAALLLAGTAAAEPAITARSVGYETLCAEMDNVLVELSGNAVERFHLRATHPSYLAAIEEDIMYPDFSNCEFPDEPIWDHEPMSTVLYQDERILLGGHRLRKTWREEEVAVVVGDRRVENLHLTQLFVRLDGRLQEIVVLYANDGYWRARPLPPEGRAEVGYGSSVVIGPIEVDRRPLAKYQEVRFDPATLTYHLTFVGGGTGAVRVAAIGRDAIDLEVSFEPPLSGPFAMLSSMYVEEDNADVARLLVRAPGEALLQRHAIPELDTVTGAAFRFGRDVPSRHNTSAPDMAFEQFEVVD